MSRKIYVVGGAESYAIWMEGDLVDSLDEADLVVFTGGTDVNPKLYGEPAHPNTELPNEERDSHEMNAYERAVEYHGKPCIGLCRGAQFLCVMNGGKLVQHQENNHPHPITTYDGLEIDAPGDHYQAQYPWGVKDFKLLGWTRGLSNYHLDGRGYEMVSGCLGGRGGLKADRLEVEDVYYPMTGCLSIQCHPEWAEESSDCVAHYRKLLNRLIKGDL